MHLATTSTTPHTSRNSTETSSIVALSLMPPGDIQSKLDEMLTAPGRFFMFSQGLFLKVCDDMKIERTNAMQHTFERFRVKACGAPQMLDLVPVHKRPEFLEKYFLELDKP